MTNCGEYVPFKGTLAIQWQQVVQAGVRETEDLDLHVNFLV